MVSTIVLTLFGRPRLRHTIKTNCVIFQTVHPEVCSIMIFYKRICDYIASYHILCMIFREKYFSCYILLTDQISLPDCVKRLEILANMCFTIICCPVCDVMNFEINLNFVSKRFFFIIKNQDKDVNISRTNRVFNIN